MSVSAVAVAVLVALLSSVLAWVLSRQVSQKALLRYEDKLRLQSEKMADFNRLQMDYDTLQKQLQEQRIKYSRLEAILLSEQNRLADNARDLQESRDQQALERQLKNQAEVQVRELETRLEEQKEHNKKHIIQMHEIRSL